MVSSIHTKRAQRLSATHLLPLILLALFAPHAATHVTLTEPLADEENVEHLRARHPEGLKTGSLLANITALLQLERPAIAEPDAQQVREIIYC